MNDKAAKEKIEELLNQKINAVNVAEDGLPLIQSDIYATDEDGNRVDDIASAREIFAELSFKHLRDDPAPIEFALCLSVTDGECAEDELDEVCEEFSKETDEFINKLSDSDFMSVYTAINEQRKEEAAADMKEFEEKVFNYKKAAIFMSIGAAIIAALMLIIEQLLMK